MNSVSPVVKSLNAIAKSPSVFERVLSTSCLSWSREGLEEHDDKSQMIPKRNR
jgi:hypothetical protein